VNIATPFTKGPYFAATRRDRRAYLRSLKTGIDNAVKQRRVSEPHCKCGRGLQAVLTGVRPLASYGGSRPFPEYANICRPCQRAA
jgi:hypothetical protein